MKAAYERWRRLFQSLLSWISHCGWLSNLPLHTNEKSFNPCCHGLAIAAVPTDDARWLHKPFQSLLSWISHCGAEDELLPGYMIAVSILVVMD